MRAILGLALLTSAIAGAQTVITLEQAASRTGRDFAAVYEGRRVTVRAQVAAPPVWALDTYYLPLRDQSDHGLVARGDRQRFEGIAPGDWIEASGTIQSLAGFPMLAPDSIRRLKVDAPPQPNEVSLAELDGFRYLGLMVRTSATVARVSDNLAGTSLELNEGGSAIAVFLPRASRANAVELRTLRAGQRVRLTGLATQFSFEPPHDNGFQIMLATPEAVELVRSSFGVSPLLALAAVGAIALIAAVWWLRERRVGTQRRSMRAFHALSEDIIAAASPAGIAEKLVRVLPEVTPATAVRLYLYHRRTRSLERVPTSTDPEPMAVPLDNPPEGLVAGAVACFNNRTLLNVPDVRRSPLVKLTTRRNLPRSAMFLPLLAHNDVVGVLEVGNARRMGYFTVEEQAAAQHLANQVAASLKLQEQQRMREQLFRSEKLAATGQLISGVASELRAPIESILQLATSLTAYGGRAAPARDLARLAGESQRASEIVSRLVSFARPEDSEPRPLDINALLASLMEFRGPEWKTLDLRVQNRLAAQPALVIAAQGQIEQVLLNLLVHAEQCAADAPGKTISASSSLIGARVLIEIGYSISAVDHDESADGAVLNPLDAVSGGAGAETATLGLGVCQGIIQSHGGEIRFHGHAGAARFEIDLPLAPAQATGTTSGEDLPVASSFTLLVVDPDAGAQRQLVRMLSAQGHRVVPGRVEEAADLAQRLRFDAVFWALRSGASRNTELQERVRAHTQMFVLITDAYDPELARVLENAGGLLLSRPIEEPGLDRVLQRIQALSLSRS